MSAAFGELGLSYADAGFGRRLGAGDRVALIMVDPVVAYLRPDSPLYAGVEAEIAVTATLAQAARRAGLPVIATQVLHQGDGRDGGLYYRKVPALAAFAAGSPDGAFAPELEIGGTDIIVTKQYASAFFGTSLSSTLHALRVDTLVVTGLTTSGCVRATAMDALNHGFAPLVVADAVGDRDPAVQAANLFDLDQKYADVVTSAEMLELFSATAVQAR